jgi:hypothetical protein
MAAKDPKTESQWTAEQIAARQEWQNLCFTLERSQADELIRDGHDKYAFAKTYLAFGQEMERVVADVRLEIQKDNFQFFMRRGIASAVMTRALAEQLLRDWNGAVASKQARLSEAFRRRFNEEIDEFVATPNHAARLLIEDGGAEVDAVVQLEHWTDEPTRDAQASRLADEVARLKRELTNAIEALIDRIPGRRHSADAAAAWGFRAA